MDKEKKELLASQVEKLEEVLSTLRKNFDCENEMPDEYSFLSIVCNNLKDTAAAKH